MKEILSDLPVLSYIAGIFCFIMAVLHIETTDFWMWYALYLVPGWLDGYKSIF